MESNGRGEELSPRAGLWAALQGTQQSALLGTMSLGGVRQKGPSDTREGHGKEKEKGKTRKQE